MKLYFMLFYLSPPFAILSLKSKIFSASWFVGRNPKSGSTLMIPVVTFPCVTSFEVLKRTNFTIFWVVALRSLLDVYHLRFSIATLWLVSTTPMLGFAFDRYCSLFTVIQELCDN